MRQASGAIFSDSSGSFGNFSQEESQRCEGAAERGDSADPKIAFI
jgi:hypothetical protein